MNEQVQRIISNKLAIPVAVGAVSLVAGSSIGYIFGSRRAARKVWDEVVEILEKENEDRPGPVTNITNIMQTPEVDEEPEDEEPEDEEPEAAEVTTDAPPKVILDAENLEEIRKRWESQSDISVSEELISERQLNQEEVREALELIHSDKAKRDGVILSQITDDSDEDSVSPVAQNIFANSGDGWDYEEELEARAGHVFYVIHADEYNEKEPDYTKHTLTYYAGDNLMADEDYSVVPNYSRTLGELKFGHGSGDPNVVYIRNDERESDYEVLLHSGSYAREVLGLEHESERAGTRGVRRMRDLDVDTTGT